MAINVIEEEISSRRETVLVGEGSGEGIISRAEQATAVEQPGVNRAGETVGVVAREKAPTQGPRIERGRSTELVIVMYCSKNCMNCGKNYH